MPDLSRLPHHVAIVRLEPGAVIPDWAWRGEFASVTRTGDEVSIVCDAAAVPAEIEAPRDWVAIKVAGPMDLAIVGVLASIADPLAKAGISLFAVSTFETDYILVREASLPAAISALRAAGHRIAD